MPLSAGARLGPYEILTPLGAGGMGEVYRARDPRMGREVAIKISAQRYTDRFEREVRAVAALNHANICQVYDVGPNYLVMELVEGKTLADRIKTGALPPEEALSIARQIADALESAHEKGIIHRDLKPANIKVKPDGTVKVLDFGLAKIAEQAAEVGNREESPTVTMGPTIAGQIMGTAGYMSPEQARGYPADRRSDIWSLGVVLYEMLTGVRVFGGATATDSLAAILKTDPDWAALPAGTPSAIRRLLRRCLERDPKRRLSDVADARLEIDEALSSGQEVLTQAPAPPARPGLRWWAAIALAVLVGVSVAVVRLRETTPDPLVSRFEIPPPPRGSFGSHGIAISPNGRFVAFPANSTDGSQRLWLRSLDSTVARPLPGTEGAHWVPFWSPDSSSIGFTAGRTLKKVTLSGEAPQTLCEMQLGVSAGAWNVEGTILFSTSTGGGLYRVSQAGGKPVRVTTVDSTKGETHHRFPVFLPDGRHYLYTTRTSLQENDAIYLASLDSQERKRLVSSHQGSNYAPPAAGSRTAHVIYLREDDTLMALPVDSARFEPVGESFRVAEQIASDRGLAPFSVSTNGILVYRTDTRSAGRQLTWFDREGRAIGTVGPAIVDEESSVSLSPDGKRVAFVARDDSGRRDIWTMDVIQGAPKRLTLSGAGTDTHPFWSADGSRIYFSSDRRTRGLFQFYYKNADGMGNEELLVTTPSSDRGYHSSPDSLLFSTGTPWQVMMLPLNLQGTGQPLPLIKPTSSQPQLSTDRRWIAYSGADRLSLGRVYVQPFPSGGGTFDVTGSRRGTQPRWRADDKEIYYIAADGKLMAVDVKTSPVFEAKEPKALFPTGLIALISNMGIRYAPSADGKRFLFNVLPPDTAVRAESTLTVVLNWQAVAKH